MGRLTRRTERGAKCAYDPFKCEDQYEDGGCGCCAHLDAMMEKLAVYEDLEEQGLLLRLPCKLGVTLYDIQEFVDECDHPEVYVIDASAIEVSKDELGTRYCIDYIDYRDEHFGTVLFASMEEAERALAERGKE